MEGQGSPRIFVVFTDRPGTAAALKAASAWANRLDFQIDLIIPQIVPYPLPASSPTVATEFTLRQAFDVAASAGVEPDVHLYLCRDRLRALLEVLPAHAVVVLGSRKRRLLSAVDRLARKLRRQGHFAILATYR